MSTKKEKVSNKTLKRESKNLTSHSKRVVLETLKEINCNPFDRLQLVRHFRDKSENHISKVIGLFINRKNWWIIN